jgi:deoxyribodipyrimidine photo-lyase
VTDEAPMTPPGFLPRRESGLARLVDFVPRAGRRYADRRNHDLGPGDRDNVSMLSPWLRHRLVLESEAVREAIASHGAMGAESFVQEVVWRTYFKGYLENRPALWSRYCRELGGSASDPGLAAGVQRAVAGETGIECFDAWSRELRELGYLHNHARMWYASIWIHTLGLPWQMGADFFLRHLVDGDPASNLLSWRWVCGLHTRGKTYLARASNIDEYTGGRFATPEALAGSAVPLDEEAIPVEGLRSADELPREPGFVLLITEEDCDPLSLELPASPGCVVGCDLDETWSPRGRASAPAAFARGAIDDALRRAEDHWKIPSARLSSADELLAWAAEGKPGQLVVPWVPTGPIADALEPTLEGLARSGVDVRRIRRPWDEFAWPAATHGYFRMRKIIPELLERFA